MDAPKTKGPPRALNCCHHSLRPFLVTQVAATLPVGPSGRAAGRPARVSRRAQRSASRRQPAVAPRPSCHWRCAAVAAHGLPARPGQAPPRPAPKKVSSAQRWPVARPPDQSQARARARAPPAAARPPAVHAPPVRCSRKEHTTTTTRLALALQWRLLLPPTACLPAVMACGVRAA